jgi:hypothetical protein
MSTFPTALEARAGSRNNLVIHAEIRAIEQAIYRAIDAGDYQVDVGRVSFDVDGVKHGYASPMTDPFDPNLGDIVKVDPTDYFAVLFTSAEDRVLREQIDFVQQVFRNLGYQITPLKNSNSGKTFMWRIMW